MKEVFYTATKHGERRRPIVNIARAVSSVVTRFSRMAIGGERISVPAAAPIFGVSDLLPENPAPHRLILACAPPPYFVSLYMTSADRPEYTIDERAC